MFDMSAMATNWKKWGTSHDHRSLSWIGNRLVEIEMERTCV